MRTVARAAAGTAIAAPVETATAARAASGTVIEAPAGTATVSVDRVEIATRSVPRGTSVKMCRP